METVQVAGGTRLDQLLKYVGVAATGGEAKLLIQEGQVTVNGKTEKRRGYKLKEGDVVKAGTASFKISIIE